MNEEVQIDGFLEVLKYCVDTFITTIILLPLNNFLCTNSNPVSTLTF